VRTINEHPAERRTEPANLDLSAGDLVPESWSTTGTKGPHAHAVKVSQEQSPLGGRTVQIVRASAPWRWGDGILFQGFSALGWRGKLVHFSAAIRARVEGPGTGAQLFVETRPTRPENIDIEIWCEPAAAATMVDRPVRSAQCDRYAVELQNPERRRQDRDGAGPHGQRGGLVRRPQTEVSLSDLSCVLCL